MDERPQFGGSNTDPFTSPAFDGLKPPGQQVDSKFASKTPVPDIKFEMPAASFDSKSESSSPLENSLSNFDQNRGVNRAKTELRLRYEAEVTQIQKQTGSLEKIRTDLGLSARKMCQLLLVDPSAWNRWSKPGGKAPPHIWRALQWYIISQEKLPGLTPNFFLSHRPMLPPAAKLDPNVVKQVQGIESSHKDLHQRIQALEDKAVQLMEELKNSQRTVRIYELAGSMIGLMILGFVIFLFLRSRG